MTHLVWFRNDLRIRDNPALLDACEQADLAKDGPVVGVFLVAETQWRSHDVGDARLGWLKQTVQTLQADLDALGIPLWVDTAATFDQCPERLLAISRSLGATSIDYNAEYPWNERRRDKAVNDTLTAAGIRCREHHGGVILQPGMVLTGSGTPYSVFTPFKRRWLKLVTEADQQPLAAPAPRPPANLTAPDPECHLAALPDLPPDPDWPAGERAALKTLDRFLGDQVQAYHDQRDYPATPGTSGLSAYLSIGSISARTCFGHARALAAAAAGSSSGGAVRAANAGCDDWINELIWREFYRHVVALFPHVSRGQAFRQHLDDLPWRHDPDGLAAWQAGMTGYPLVDAGMRQLTGTGFMHNRLRMVTAMFLSKHLLIDWRQGERFFMRHLRDGDFASNNGGWQWSASTGTDAAPYFRIFNPASQAKKFDPEGEFVKRWIPELGPGTSSSYPSPIVDHAFARQRALDFFKHGGWHGA